MIDRTKSSVLWRLAAVAAAFVAVSAATGGDYIHEDARIQGKEIHSFTDNGEDAMVVLGDFSLTLGQYALRGRDAVIWIRSQPTGGGLSQYDMEVFIEGNATVTEPGGSTTSDKLMFVTLRSMGRLRASGTMSPKPLADFPLYKRALATRKDAANAATATATAPAELPPLIISDTPAPKPALRVARPATPMDVRKPQAPQPVLPVEFHADRFSSREIGEGDQKRRVTVAHGNVYVSQGNPDSELFLEMRAQTAVVFSARRAAGENNPSVAPYMPKVTGIQTPGGGQEVVTGVYLDGDVVISRGTRYMRGPSAYYDFTSNRALMVEPVFRAVDENREIPIYFRAAEARVLSDREVLFHKAVVTTSDFHTPSFALAAREAYVKDETPYDAKGVRVGEQQWLTEVKDATFEVYGVPVAWTPASKSDFSESTTPLRRVSVGSHGRMGFGGEAEWHLFRLLGLVEPKGVNAILETDWYERGPLAGIDLDYDRESYHGYSKAYGVVDQKQDDDFGDKRKDIYAPENRGWLLTRHKQYLPNDWEVQFELSYICDRNFLEEFFPSEHFTGKDQETLLYAKKQQDNWALTALLQYRLNRFQSQTESAPQLGFNLIGQSFADDKLTFFSENRVGANRFRPDNAKPEDDSSFMARLDSRDEVDWPMHFGPVNVVPYAVGRVTYWSEKPEAGFMGRPEEGANDREYGQLGIRSNMHFWRVYRDIHSRLWDLDGIKHVVTPEVTAFLGESAHGVGPDDLYPMDPDVEDHLGRKSGVGLTVAQRLQTKRGEGENRRIVDWMRLAVTGAFFDGDGFDNPPSDGRFFFSRPEYSIARNAINYDYQWNISDSTTFLADGNYDIDRHVMGRWDFGLAVQRDPRLRYYLGIRSIEDLDSTIATVGATYQINEKYSVSGFFQFDADYNSGQTLGSSLSLIRKFPRWYLGTTFITDKRTGDLGLFVTVWPEGIPEVRLGSGRTTLLSQSDLN